MSGGEEEKDGPDGPSLRMVLISDTHSQHDDLPKPFPKGRHNIWAVLWIRIRPWKSFGSKSGRGIGPNLAKFFSSKLIVAKFCHFNVFKGAELLNSVPTLSI